MATMEAAVIMIRGQAASNAFPSTHISRIVERERKRYKRHLTRLYVTPEVCGNVGSPSSFKQATSVERSSVTKRVSA